ncbi:MAG: endonuclease NucS [Nitrososphaerota archaeon]
MASVDEVRNYIRQRLKEGVDVYYGEGGLAGEVARKFGLKISSAGYRVWEVLRQMRAKMESNELISRQMSLVGETELQKEIEEKEEELTKGGFTLESELERQILQNIELVEKGLVVKERQYRTSAGVADILAEDASGNYVIIELKSGDADEKALVQLLRYMGAVKQSTNKDVRGILIANHFSDYTKVAASMIPNIKLKTYGIKIEISDIS